MKKFISVLMTFVILLTMLPLCVTAAETDPPRSDSLVEKAAAVFPEYANKLQNSENSISPYSFNSHQRELLIKETRAVSDSESITYAEYSDGLILLNDFEFTGKSTTVSRDENSTSTDITLDIEAACIYAGSTLGHFYLDGVKYSLRSTDFDCITDTGDPSRDGNCTSATRITNVLNETNTGYAELAYHLHFRYGSASTHIIDSVVVLFVGEDTAVLEHVDYNDYI